MRYRILLLLMFFTCISFANKPVNTDKLAVFCKVWGFLKYYHPEAAKGKIDWDSVFMHRAKLLEKLNTKEEINNFYTEWLSSLGDPAPCKKCKTDIPDSLKMNLNIGWISDTSVFFAAVISKLEYIRDNHNTGYNYYVQSFRGVGNTNYENEKPYIDSVYPSREMRLLSLSRYWNIINYFYPYKYRLDKDWNTVLEDMLPKFKNAPDTISYHLAMTELVADINDSHAAFSDKYTVQFFGVNRQPFNFKLIDGKAIVTGFYNDTVRRQNDIQYGDVILKVNKETIPEIFGRLKPYATGSNISAIRRNEKYMIFSGSANTVHMTLDRNGAILERDVSRAPFESYHYNWGADIVKDTFKIIENNIGYIDMGLLQKTQAEEAMEKLKNTRAIIFDVRNYPNETYWMISKYLNEEKKAFAKFTKPDLSYPGIFNYTKPALLPASKSNYTGKVILLFNETTQSHAEFTVMALETASHVIKIGSQTAGADGNVSVITFPGGYKTWMTGIGVFYPDGRETQRIGIVPDILVKPTIEGIRAHRDEVLEKAIETANKNN